MTRNGERSRAAATIPHTINSVSVQQRLDDGYIHATAMCKAAGKLFNDYSRLDTTKAFMAALSAGTGIPVSILIKTLRGGNGPQGTWVHPKVAIHLAQWLSPEFAVQVSTWVFDWLSTRARPVQEDAPPSAPSPGPSGGLGMVTLDGQVVLFDVTAIPLHPGDKALAIVPVRSPRTPRLAVIRLAAWKAGGDRPHGDRTALQDDGPVAETGGRSMRYCIVIGKVLNDAAPTDLGAPQPQERRALPARTFPLNRRVVNQNAHRLATATYPVIVDYLLTGCPAEGMTLRYASTGWVASP